jgi:hypothetical protein
MRSDTRHRLLETIDPPCPEHDGGTLACQMFGDGQADA